MATSRAAPTLLFLHVLAFGLAGCAPSLPFPGDGRGAPVTDDAGAPTVAVEPAAAFNAVAPVIRVVVAAPDALSIDPKQLVLVRGEVGKAHLRQLAKDDVSATFAERFVPSIVWAGPTGLILAPTVVLDRGETYSVACGEPPIDVELRVAEVDAAPVLPRVWPPAGASGTADLGIWCGSEALPRLDVATALSPGGPAGVLRTGAAPGLGARCLRFEGTGAAAPGEAWLAPPALELDGHVVAALDPRPFSVDLAAEEPPALPCSDGEVRFGPGCARVADDRIAARAPDAPLLWAIQGAGLDLVTVTGAGNPFVVAPLPPLTAITLDVATFDAGGRLRSERFSAETGAPRPHLVLNEVLANPLGPEPAAEWVEIVNDGTAPAELGGYVLADGGGEVVLPMAELAPGAFALVVNESFVDSDGVDPPPASGTTLVTVAKLGKNGLSNEGEPLELLDPDGALVSRFSATPKPKAGLSVARVHPTAPDGLASSFVVDVEGPTPGAPNGP